MSDFVQWIADSWVALIALGLAFGCAFVAVFILLGSRRSQPSNPPTCPGRIESAPVVEERAPPQRRGHTMVDAGDPNWDASHASRQSRQQSSRSVEFAAFLPRGIEAGTAFLLDIWAYLSADREEVCSLASQLERDQKTGVKSGVRVARGSVLAIHVDIRPFHIEDPDDLLQWNGTPVSTTYAVRVPAGLSVGRYLGKATISCAGMVIGKLHFSVLLCNNASAERVVSLAAASLPRSAFASYASDDREEVLARVQGMQKIAPTLDIFVDVDSLRSGDRWREQLVRHVPTKDRFFLFWSASARESKWVDWEWRLALVRRGLDYIDPVPLDDPELCPPPTELSGIHFGDRYLSSICYLRAKAHQAL
ncbi:MAG TPA: toll/interleukin-1 receptor domain-containing protein [Rubrivivax sp.]|nr:toll/interleukin-1 receptor domain-containing protein [Rubrivivax sp.]